MDDYIKYIVENDINKIWHPIIGQTTLIYYGYSDFLPSFVNQYTDNKFKNIGNSFSQSSKPDSAQKKIIEESLEAWSNIANIKFIEDNSKARLFFSMGIIKNDYNKEKILGRMQLLTNDAKYLSILFDKDEFSSLNTIDKKNYFKSIAIHEEGHFLGLKHPFNGNAANSSNFPIKSYNIKHFTIMTYQEIKNRFNDQPIYALTPMYLDIKAVQKYYGANHKSNNINNIYKLDQFSKGAFTIWDAGGIDLFDLSAIHSGIEVDLNPAVINVNDGINHRSKINPELYYYIADGVIIENVITGNGNDIILGNKYANNIDPGSGNNIVKGYGGADRFIFKKNYIGKNIIKDFVSGLSKLVINSNYSIKLSNNDTIVKINDCEIKLENCAGCLKTSDIEIISY